jgi:hypothetical protein
VAAVVSRSGASAFDCAPSISWVKDAGQVILVEGRGERCWSLRGVEAVIWDLLILKYGYDRLVDFLAELSQSSKGNAEATLLATIGHWEEEGIVTGDGRERHGKSGD